MVSFSDLRDADVSQLAVLRDAWASVSERMGQASSQCETLTESLAAEGWSGTAADAAAVRFTDLAQLVSAGETESAAIGDIVGQAATSFTDEHDGLLGVLDEISGVPQLTVTEAGTVQVVAPATASRTEVVLYESWQASYQESIDSHVESATEADTRIAEALRMAGETANSGDTTFNATAMNLEQIEQAEQDAETAAELMATPFPDELSDEDWEQLQELMSENGDNPVFAQRLVTLLGPEGLVGQYGNLVYYASTQGDEDLVARMRDIEAGMGHALATATHPDTVPPLDDGYLEELMTVGAMSYGAGSGIPSEPGHFTVTGYDVIAPLLEHGTYHEDFLVPVAEHVTRLSEHGYIDSGDMGGAGVERINYTLEDDEYEHPMNAVMEALGDNPAASLSYFGGSTDYDHLDYPANAYDLTGDMNETRPLPPLENENRVDWALDFADDNSASSDASDYGDAVTAAATGLPEHADPATTPRVEHTPAMTEVANRAVEYVDEHPDQFEPGGGMENASPAFGRMAAGYMEDIHDYYSEDVSTATLPPPLTVDEDGETVNAFADQNGLNGFLAAVSHNPDAYGSIYGASLAVMEQTALPTFEASQTNPDVVNGHIAEGHSWVMGVTDQGWVDIVQNEHLQDAESRNSFLGSLGTAATGIGLTHPGLGAAATGFNELVVGPMQDSNIDSAHAAADESEDELDEENRRRHQDDIAGLVASVLEANGVPSDRAETIGDAAGEEFFDTYSSGRGLVD